jgi:hypothetical protein
MNVLKQMIKTKNSYSVFIKHQIFNLIRQKDPLHQPKKLMAQNISALGFSVMANVIAPRGVVAFFKS